VGKGRLAEPDDVVAAAGRLLGGTALAGRAVLVTAGPTFEDIDPVRFVGNRSSGRMGYAVAREAARRGAAVVLVTGPTHLDPPAGVDVVRVRSAADMHRAVLDRAAGADAVVMAAAVADYTPQSVAGQKVAKQDGGWSLPLVRTIDILADLGRLPSRTAGRPVLIGFAAETHDVLEHAEAKRRRKGVDLIVANDVARADAGFEVDTNAVTFVGDDGLETLPLMSKPDVAARIVDRLERLLGVRPAAPAPR
jgi:phosphopantothenoylcysteine decarboxylase/phosphopantothenate--cysteine ligase